jgi:photosystem II stability/assembly factor-like uncharacterized protein
MAALCHRFVTAVLLTSASLLVSASLLAQSFIDVLDMPAKPSPLASQHLLSDIAVAGKDLIAVGQRGHILYSGNQGQSWQQAQVPVSSDLTAVFFPTASLGWAVGHDGVVLHSTDSGRSWHKQLDGHQLGPLMHSYFQTKLDNLSADASPEQHQLYLTLLQEAQLMTTQGADKPFLDLWFKNATEGYLVGAFNLIFYTKDAGLSWQPLQDKTDNPAFLHLNAISGDGDQLYIAGEQGLLLRLNPENQQFEKLPTPYHGSYFGLLTTSELLLVYGMQGTVLRSTNQGLDWTQIDTALSLSLTAALSTSERIYLFSQAGHRLSSDDQGQSFRLDNSPLLSPVSAVVPVDHKTLVLAGSRGLRLSPL